MTSFLTNAERATFAKRAENYNMGIDSDKTSQQMGQPVRQQPIQSASWSVGQLDNNSAIQQAIQLTCMPACGHRCVQTMRIE